MTDPARLLDATLDGSSRRALRAALLDEPPPEVKAQLWHSITLALPAAGVLLGASTVAGGVQAASGASSATAATAAGTAATVAGTTATVVGSSGLGFIAGKAVAIGLGIGLAFTAASTVATRAPEPVPSTAIAASAARAKVPRAASVVPSVTAVAAIGLPEVLPQTTPTVPAMRTSAVGEPTSDELREESELLVRTREALSASEAGRALELIGEHRRRFAGGRLVQERDALEVQALVISGESAQAEAQARRFFLRYPESPHAAKIRAVVGAR